MEDTLGTREPRVRPRERDPDRRPRPDRDRHPERPRDRAGDRRRERNGDARRDGDRRGDRDMGRDRDPRQDRHRDAGRRAGEQRAREKSRQSRTRDAAPGPTWDAARGPTWDAAPPPWPAPWETPEPPAARKENSGRRAPQRSDPGEKENLTVPPPNPDKTETAPPGGGRAGGPGKEEEGPRTGKASYSETTSGRYVPSHPRPGLEEVEYYQSEAEGLLECHKCRYLCTGRGVVQIVEVILNGMVLMCIVASYFVLAGFSASFASGSGFGNNYYSPFEGTELEQVRQLDQQYTVLRAPLIYGGVAVSLGLGVLTMGVLLQGAKSLTKLPGKWLLVEAAFSLLAAVGCCVGIGVYLHVALQINSTDTCKARERLYARKGLTWMNCQLAGTDGAAATFACLLVIMYSASVVLALRSYRKQKLYKDSQEDQRNGRAAPEYLWSGTL